MVRVLQPGGREHRLHLRDAAGGLPRRHGARCRGLPALARAARERPSACASGCCSRWRAACLLGTASLWLAPQTSRPPVLQAAGRRAWRRRCGAEAALAALAFLLPTIVMGALFSHLGTQALRAAASASAAPWASTRWAPPLAPLLFGVLLLPALGAEGRAAARGRRLPAAGARGARGARPAGWAPRPRRRWRWRLGAAAGLRRRARRRAASSATAKGRLATVSVVEDADGVARLRINNRQQEGSSATLFADARQALLPLLLHPAPRRALFLGLGTGVTAGVGGRRIPQLQVDAVELLPEVIDASAPLHAALRRRAATRACAVMAADARRFVRASRAPLRRDRVRQLPPGAQRLGLALHRRALPRRARAAGRRAALFCQWLPLHQLDLDTLRSIVRAFLAVYPQGWAMLATNSLETPVLGLVARARRRPLRPSRSCAQRLADAALPQRPPASASPTSCALLGSFVAGPRALARFAGDAPLNTDDHPVVAYRAPRITYAPDSLPRDRLLALLGELDVGADEVLSRARRRHRLAPRLAAYWRARDRFLAGRPRRAAVDRRAPHAGAGARAAARRCCASAPTSAPPTTRCCGWRQRWRAPMQRARARCSPSWRGCSLHGPRAASRSRALGEARP